MTARTQARSSTGRAPVSKTGGWGFKSLRACQITEGSPIDLGVRSVNREVKRMMKKREGAADRLKRPTPQQAAAKRKRTKPKDFVKEVRGELARVAWPNRQEVFTYTLVVVVSVTFFMILIWGLDLAFTKLVVKLISGA